MNANPIFGLNSLMVRCVTMSRIKATIYGTWVPNGDGYELAIYPIVQRWRDDGDRIMPQGSFSLINLHDDKTLEKILDEDYRFTSEMKVRTVCNEDDDIQNFFAAVKNEQYTPTLELHNLGEFQDKEGFEYEVYLMITNYNLTATPTSSKYAWDGMYLLEDIELDEDEELEREILATLRKLKGPATFSAGRVEKP
ncbi:hypothetical protein AVT69_gp302 [Pseudomonas phage PhiPA3]|uniref:Uncharacterized protein 304 n=1 Tax=Pseudomonas phage PhiPA3 TaxID=998086 RepID=F8SJE0_BPPA3|nr:hypothetical protein AVT69_gp302 [Pseudomonas phage PhiPA3]AEH03727.1 hypothetical protein [Pseudomonas phage PhiPA3]